MIFKIDVDGVLRDIISPICLIYNKTFNEQIESKDIREYDISKTFVKCNNVVDYFFRLHSREVFLESCQFRNAAKALETIHHNGDKVVICSWQFSNTNRKYTLDWLEKNHFYFDDVCFTKDKEIIVSDIMIDDNPDYFQKNNGKTINVLINHEYNIQREVQNAVRFDSVYDFVQSYYKLNLFSEIEN